MSRSKYVIRRIYFINEIQLIKHSSESASHTPKNILKRASVTIIILYHMYAAALSLTIRYTLAIKINLRS